MAEGFIKSLKRPNVNAYSAGVRPEKEIAPLAVKVMSELGINISSQKPKGLDAIKGIKFDYVITMCEDAQENCPYFPATVKVIHKGFNDPMGGTIDTYRKVRDEIKSFTEEFVNEQITTAR